MSVNGSSASEDEIQDDQHEVQGVKAQRKWDALHPKIVNVITALGGLEEVLQQNENGETEVVKVYRVGEEVTGCLKDLKRFFRLDDHDPDRTVVKIFYKQGLVQNDLVPIIQTMYRETDGFQLPGLKRERRIALMAAELICALTWPLDIPEELKEWADLTEGEAKIDVNSQLRFHSEYKNSILKADLLSPLLAMTAESIGKSRRERMEVDESIITLFLHIIRNLAFIRDRGTGVGKDLQSTFIHQMSQHSVFDLLLTIASCADSPEFSTWNVLTMEIMWLIFRCVENVKDLFVGVNSHGAGGSAASNKLTNLLAVEENQKRFSKRHEASRHSRFGTTLQLNVADQKYILHKQTSIKKGAGEAIDSSKKLRTRTRTHDDLTVFTILKPFANDILRSVGISFIEHGFNVFFSSILSDIRMERSKIKQADTIRFLFLLRFFLEFFRHLKDWDSSKARREGKRGENEDLVEHGWDLIGEMLDPTSFAFITARMKVALEEKPILWTELHASIDCFIQTLLIISALSASQDEDDRDLADILQNKLYYEGETLDMILQLIGKYKTQSVQYLNSIVQLGYVLLKMLEKYSKSKAHMYIRKKTIRRNKKRDRKDKQSGEVQNEEEIILDAEEREVDDVEEVAYREHTFTFEVFENKFSTENVLRTLIIFLRRYEQFESPEQMKWVVNLLHRQAVKAQMWPIFFKVTAFEIFHNILENQRRLPKQQPYQDLLKLINFVLRKFFVTIESNPFAVAECFFPRRTVASSSSLDKISEDDTVDENKEKPKALRLPAEFVIEEELPVSQKIAIAVASLIEKDEEYLVEWVKNQTMLAVATRTHIVALSGENLDTESEETLGKFEDHAVRFDSVDTQRAATKNSQLKLLLRLLRWESEEDYKSKSLVWKIPKSSLPRDLEADIKLIDESLINPWNEEGKTVSDMLTKVKKKRPLKPKVLETDTEGEEEATFTINGKEMTIKKRGKSKKLKRISAKHDVGSKDEAQTSRKRKRAQEIKKFKSAQFINSDDENWSEGEDAAFFEREKQQRLQTSEQNGIRPPPPKVTTKIKRGSRKRKRSRKSEDETPQSTTMLPSSPKTLTGDEDSANDLEVDELERSGEVSEMTMVKNSEDKVGPLKKKKKKMIIDSDDSE